MSIKVKGFLQDVGGASRVTKLREENFAKGSPIPDPKDPIRELADKLHPKHMVFKVVDIREASPSSRVFRFESGDGHIPVFQSGQYVNFRFFEITVRRNVPYLVPDYLFENVKVGDELEGALPFGFFYYEPMRDSRQIVALAGGSGITPFHSMAKEIAYGKLRGLKLTILYGSVKANDIVLKDELAAIEAACPDIKVVHVLSDEPDWPGEKGFITREIIEKYSTPDCTYMFCGPLPMFRFVKKALDEMSVPVRRFRHDVVNNPADVSTLPGYPKGTEEKTFKITVVRGIHEDVIDAKASEPVAVALERSGIAIDTHCRNGECGFCRSHLLSGEIFVSPIGDGRRRMDKEMGWFHACSSWPLTDLKIKIPIM